MFETLKEELSRLIDMTARRLDDPVIEVDPDHEVDRRVRDIVRSIDEDVVLLGNRGQKFNLYEA